MRKKFFAMYALVGALVASPVFTSCIDGEESASVTAVRNAKAEQIKNATAIAQAQAEYQEKMNALDLTLKQMQVESNQISLEEKKVNFEKVKYEAEEAIANAKYNTAYYTKLLYQYQDEILTELTGNYTTALDDVVSYKESIIKKNADIVALEEGIVSIHEYITEQTEELNGKIAAAEQKIEIWKDAEGGVNKEEIEAEIAVLEETLNKLNAENTALQAEYGSFDYGWFDFQNNGQDVIYNSYQSDDVANLATIKAARELSTLADYMNQHYAKTDAYDSWNFVATDADGYLVLNQKNITLYKQHAESSDHTDALENDKETLAKMEAALGTEADKADTKYQSDDTHLSLTKYAELAAAKAALATAEKTYNEKKEAEDKAQAAYNEKKTAENEAQAAWAAEDAKGTDADATKLQALADALTAAQAATATAQEALTAAQTAFTQAIKDAYTDAADAVEVKELAVAQAIDNINNQKNFIAYREKNAAIEAEFDTYVAAFSGEDYEAYKAAKDALAAKGDEIKDANTEKSALEALNDLTDVDALIAKETEKIVGWKEELAALENAASQSFLPGTGNYNGLNGGYYTEAEIETVIALIKEQITNLEIKLELAEARAKQAKAELDAYLSTDEEGGEAEA